MTQPAAQTAESSSASNSPALFGRRTFMATAAAAATAVMGKSLLARDYGPHAQPVRYPDPDIVVLDKKFAKYKIGNTPIQRLHTGMLWAEGPAWFPAAATISAPLS